MGNPEGRSEGVVSGHEYVRRNPGNFLRECRRKLGFTQEAVSYGVCSLSKYSRIEAGRDLPSAEEFSLFMERLSQTDIDYEESFEGSSTDRRFLLLSIWNEAMLDHWEKATDLISVYRWTFSPRSRAEKQLVAFLELMHRYYIDESFRGMEVCRAALEALQITQPSFDYDTVQLSFVPAPVEFMLINVIACGFFETNQEAQYERALALTQELVRLAASRRRCFCFKNALPALLINLSCFEISHGDLVSAARHLRQGRACFTTSGGFYLYCKLLRCEYILCRKRGLIAKSDEILQTIRAFFDHITSPPPVGAFIKNSPKIMVF